MHILTKSLSVIAGGVLSMAFMPAAANSIGLKKAVDMPQYMARFSHDRNALNSGREAIIRQANRDLDISRTPSLSDESQDPVFAVLPAFSNGPVTSFNDIDGPDGELWYYTSKLYNTHVKHQYYTETILQAYQFDIYDAAMNHVGTIYDKMDYAEDELRVPGPNSGIGLLPIVTKNFFNTADDYEVIVGITVNTDQVGVNRTYSRVYSIGGEKVEKIVMSDDNAEGEKMQCDKMIKEFPSLVSDVLDASHDGVENFYLGFGGETKVDYYGKADMSGDIKLVHTFSVETPYRVQGDFENTPMLLSFFRDGKAYVVFPTYREDFFDFENGDTVNGDMSMHPGNFLDIRLYTINGDKVELLQTTSVPMHKDSNADVLATYYQVGGFRWSDDVNFGDFTNDGRASFYVTTSNHIQSSDSASDYCFYVYDPEGNKIRTIFEKADKFFSLSDVEGRNPQHVFTENTDEGYYYSFVDLITSAATKIFSYVDTGYDEPELISANVDRVDLGGGDYKYAFEMRVPILDEDENTFIRVAWFNADGSFDRIDEVNIGKNVDFAQCFINGSALKPDIFNGDDDYEYMALVKYILNDGGNEEHLVIAQARTEEKPFGEELLRLTPCDKGALNNIGLYPVNGNTMLMVRYYDGSNFTSDFYKLPLEKTEISGMESVATEGISYANGLISAPDLRISVYDIAGTKVAEAVSVFDTCLLSQGVYMVVTEKGVRKILVK